MSVKLADFPLSHRYHIRRLDFSGESYKHSLWTNSMLSNKHSITTALLYLLVLTNILGCGIFVLVGEFWPPEASVQSKTLSVPLTLLIVIASSSIAAMMVWRKRGDGTYIFDCAIRWASIGAVLIEVICAVVATIIIFASIK